jgi:uncharacterized protein (TIGR03437 family)
VVKITVDPTGLTPGTYKTNLAISGSYPDSKLYPRIPVTLTVLPSATAPKATITRMVDAASSLGGAVSPGEIVTLSGSGLGPAIPMVAQPATGSYASTLAGWTFAFDGVAAPILYLSDQQSMIIAPFGIAARTSTNVTVATGGTTSVAFVEPVSAANPSVFTADGSGSGIATALNVAADGTLSPHTAATAAAKGSVVRFYATGLGVTTPVMSDGSLAASPLPGISATVRVLVGGQAADVLQAGPAAGQVAGMMQIDVRIPASAPSGLTSLLVLAGENASQPGVTLAVR